MNEFLLSIVQSDSFTIILKLVLIFILSGFIGLERASLSKPAGFRTHVLVGMSGVLTMICGQYLYNEYGSDITRIPAQLLSGIGFLGAGTILRDGFNVKGLTTAASLLVVACLGLCVGAGLYLGSIIATIVVYLVLTYSKYISDKVEHYNDFSLNIMSKKPKEIIEEVQDLLDKSKIEIKNITIDEAEDKDDVDIIKIVGQYRDEINKNKIMSKLMSMDGVTKVLEI